ncbi:N-acetylmuramoyl-L-alanine amidase [Nocardioides sp. TF02-7]|uniref:N-acetylmuramoyl-L-alanine amidase n=1 Tax=Nocardioides sp. TF02-7 TaxID=2917724 RepID=UPI001F058E0F|nr:N-acetylmuramoyl-L-alanine amidase [Nocardioides sp. TF02-7]UMG91706.1 N-acetylmuramoyl-L-alanine amidase [Nocardioides sp. TF02-7]
MTMGFSDLPLARRDLSILPAAAAAATAVGATHAAPARSVPPATTLPGRRRLVDDGGIAALDLELDTLPATTRRAGGRLRTPVIEADRFRMVGVTWRGGRGRVWARWRRTSGGWTGWRELPPLSHGPDRRGPERGRRGAATDLTWTGPSDAVQLELTGAARAPVLTLLELRRLPGDRRADERLSAPRRNGGGTLPKPGAVPMPRMLFRKAWGPNPAWRNGSPSYNRRIRQLHVHHTVNGNDYRRADVPAMIRAMYRYHTKNLGWSDIGYNFLVDRFGRLWVGRAGGPRKAVRGAHTLGFNHASVGVAVIGSYETTEPPRAVIRALVRIASWKLDLYDGRPRARIRIRSGGSDRFREGRRVRLPTIDGHRDTNQTACPGARLYAALPAVRRRTARRIRKFRRRQASLRTG